MGLETIVGLALAAAGTGMQMSARNSSRKAMNRQVVSSLKQQEQFQRQATPLAQQGLKTVQENRGGRLADFAGTMQQRYQQAGQIPSAGQSPLPVDTQRANAAIAQQQGASAGGQGYAEQALSNVLSNQRIGTNLGVISNLASSAAGTAPILTQLAGQKGATLGAIGSLMSTAGSLASVYGGLKPALGSTAVAAGGNPTMATTRDWSKVS